MVSGLSRPRHDVGPSSAAAITYWLIVRDTTPLEDTATGLVAGITPAGP
jgi:hypothetical protein